MLVRYLRLSKVWIRADAQGTLVNGDRAIYALVAQPRVGGVTITADTEVNTDAGVENVFADGIGDITEANAADGDHDGRHSDSMVFVVEAPSLSLQKVSETVWDDFTCAENAPGNDSTADVSPALCAAGNARAIPGAYVRYTLTITNTGNADTSVNLSDTVDTDTEIVTASIVVENGEGSTVTPGGNTSTTTVLSLTAVPVPAATPSDDTDVVIVTFFVTVK